MNNTIQQIVYFALVWIIFIVISSIKLLKEPYNTFIMSIIFITMVSSLYYLIKQSYEKYRLLEITPAKKCELGSYTWGAEDSEQRRFCCNPSNLEEIQSVSCSKGYHGMPIRFEYTPESNDEWKNERCV